MNNAGRQVQLLGGNGAGSFGEPMHYYCEDDPQFTTPMCGAKDRGAEDGMDCPFCALIVDTADAPCAFCRLPHCVAS